MTVRVVIVGAGPAGAMLSRALQLSGVDVVLVDGAASPWTATYGAWCDEVEPYGASLDIGTPWRRTWSTTRVVTGREHLISRPYGVFDNDELRRRCIADVGMVVGAVETMMQGECDAFVRLADGRELRADVVVDARGAGAMRDMTLDAALDTVHDTVRDADVGVQTAYGVVVSSDELAKRGIGGDVMTLMDWSPVTASMPPTFLYAMQLSDDDALLEETSLCAQPAYEHAELRGRLARRMGEDLTTSARSVEVVHIPMSSSTPPRRVDVLRFGAAAGLVHPVTGYSVTASLRRAPVLADALVAAYARGERGSGLRDAAWSALWTPAMRRVRALHRLGVHVSSGLDARDTSDFFDAFFSLPADVWGPYLRVDATPAEVRRAMFGVFSSCSLRLKRRLMGYPGELARALVAR
jgi:lycopene beta-cyclase